jgi:hypothetical protein
MSVFVFVALNATLASATFLGMVFLLATGIIGERLPRTDEDIQSVPSSATDRLAA